MGPRQRVDRLRVGHQRREPARHRRARVELARHEHLGRRHRRRTEACRSSPTGERGDLRELGPPAAARGRRRVRAVEARPLLALPSRVASRPRSRPIPIRTTTGGACATAPAAFGTRGSSPRAPASSCCIACARAIPNRRRPSRTSRSSRRCLRCRLERDRLPRRGRRAVALRARCAGRRPDPHRRRRDRVRLGR